MRRLIVLALCVPAFVVGMLYAVATTEDLPGLAP
jgi:hypothetical protein